MILFHIFLRHIDNDLFGFFHHALDKVGDFGHVVDALGCFTGGHHRFCFVPFEHGLDGFVFKINQRHIFHSGIAVGRAEEYAGRFFQRVYRVFLTAGISQTARRADITARNQCAAILGFNYRLFPQQRKIAFLRGEEAGSHQRSITA